LFLGDLLPFVGWRVLGVAEGQAEQIRLPPFGIAGAAGFGDFDKAERDDFADGGGDGATVNVVADEVVIGDRQLAVIGAAVVGELDLDAVEDAPCGQAEDAPGGRAQHGNGMGCELAAD